MARVQSPMTCIDCEQGTLGVCGGLWLGSLGLGEVCWLEQSIGDRLEEGFKGEPSLDFMVDSVGFILGSKVTEGDPSFDLDSLELVLG